MVVVVVFVVLVVVAFVVVAIAVVRRSLECSIPKQVSINHSLIL